MHTSRSNIVHLLLAVCLTGSLASCSLQTRIKRADKRYAIGEYYEAAEFYRGIIPKLKKKDKALKGELCFRQGECYRILNSPKAVTAYQNAIKCGYAERDSIVLLHQAKALHYQGRYADAAKQYQAFLLRDTASYEAGAGLYACQQMADWKKNPTRYKVAPEAPLNVKRYSTFAPRFIGDDDAALMFTSNRVVQKKKDKKNSPVTGAPINQLYTARRDKQNKWTELDLAEGLYEAENDSDKTAATAELGVCCFTEDGRTMYFTYSKPINGQDRGARIFTSSRASGAWGEPQELILFKDSTISCGHPAINHTGDTLFFASDSPDGLGGKDIWFSVLEGSEWTVPQNMGPDINTSGDEMFPMIRKNGAFYFASNGHPGYGGLDIFLAMPDTTRRGELAWTLENMGLPINSQGDDFGITFAPGQESGYFSSNRGQKKGQDQIYSFYLPEFVVAVEGTVRDNRGEQISGATLRLIGSDGTNQKLQTRRDGTYRIKLNREVNYLMLGTARGYLNQMQQFSTTGLRDSYTYTQDFQLTTLSKPVTMNNVFYEFGKYSLTAESAAAMNDLCKLLNDNPNIAIELSAHTDYVGNDNFNKDLSAKRAQACVTYLTEKGIAPARLQAVGYGEEQPVTADAELHRRYKFLPEGQVLDEAFVLTLPEAEQEICNQINRRTEFKVISTSYGLY